MPIVVTTQSITLRSEPLMAGTQIEVDPLTAQQLIAAGQAKPVELTVTAAAKQTKE